MASGDVRLLAVAGLPLAAAAGACFAWRGLGAGGGRGCGGSGRAGRLCAALWLLLPFLPAANVLFHPGLFIAERVLYLPSVGYALLLAQLLHELAHLPWAKRPLFTQGREKAGEGGREKSERGPRGSPAALRGKGGSLSLLSRCRSLSRGKAVWAPAALGVLWMGARTRLRNCDWDSQESLFDR